MEQPKVLQDTIASAAPGGLNADALDGLDVTAYDRIVIAACGSAYNAGMVGKYVIERLSRLTVRVELASEFRYMDISLDEKSLVILVSQSGETADTIAALREAKAKGATTLGIVNVVGSTVAKECDICLFTLAGPEIAVATTKAFSAQLALLYILAIRFAARLGKLKPSELDEWQARLEALPGQVAEVLENIDALQHSAAESISYQSIFFIGRNIDYAIALEGSLKLKEISYIHSEAYAGGELKHGTISLVEEGTLVVSLANCPRLYEKISSNVEQVLSRGAKVLMIGNCPAHGPDERQTLIGLPQCHELLSPSLSVIALQLFSYYVAANKGLDIDKPRNLAKSVTVE
jgi:glucosamine--fructose-6-phosphate aminotransferase (isomerizing)